MGSTSRRRLTAVAAKQARRSTTGRDPLLPLPFCHHHQLTHSATCCRPAVADLLCQRRRGACGSVYWSSSSVAILLIARLRPSILVAFAVLVRSEARVRFHRKV